MAPAAATIVGVVCTVLGFMLASSAWSVIRDIFGRDVGSAVTGLCVGVPAFVGLVASRFFEPRERHVRHAIRGPRSRDAAIELPLSTLNEQ